MDGKIPVGSRRLNGVDAAFLYLERTEIPLNIAAVMIFDRTIPFEQLLAHIESRLDLIPRYRQIVVAPPFNLDYPSWEDAPRFDIREHIFPVHLPAPGGQAQLEDLAGRLLSRLMDRSKPLWEIHLVDGLEGGRGAIVLRVHHSLADGVAGMSMIKLLLDEQPEPKELPKPKPRPAHRSGPPPSLFTAIAGGIRSSLENLISAEEGVLRFAQAMLANQGEFACAARLLPEVLSAVERLPFNKPCGGERKFCWTEIDLSEAQAIRAAAGGSVNDVILMVLTRAISRYVELHGQTVTNRLIRVVCPFNLRQDNGESMGNQITFMPVVLPLDIADPVKLLHAVSERTAAMKHVRAGHLLGLVASCLGATPPPVQWMMWRGIAQVMLPLPLLNIICTNIHGPAEPLYCLGRRLVASYPQVPTGYELGVNLAVQSYCGKLSFGLIADAHVASDVTRLRDFMAEAFKELRLATGVPKARPPRPEPRPRKPRAARPPAARRARPRRARPEPPVEVPAAELAPVAVAEPVEAPPPEPAAAPAPQPEPAEALAEAVEVGA